MVDGVEGKAYDGIGNGTLQFSPDSSRLGFLAVKVFRHLVVVDGQEGQSFLDMTGNFVFSTDSKHVAALVGHGARWKILIDDVESTESYVGFPLSAPLMFESATKLHTVALRQNEAFRLEVELKSGL